MKIKDISSTARISFKQQTRSGDVFYTFEETQTWGVEDEPIENIPQIHKQLWETVNNEVNQQIMEVKQAYKIKAQQQMEENQNG